MPMRSTIAVTIQILREEVARNRKLNSETPIELFYADVSYVCTLGWVSYVWQFNDENQKAGQLITRRNNYQ